MYSTSRQGGGRNGRRLQGAAGSGINRAVANPPRSIYLPLHYRRLTPREDTMQDQSTSRQYAEGVSPLTQVREYPMTEQREEEAAKVVRYRAKIMGAGKAATAWGVLDARNAVKAGESAHRAIEIGTARVVDIMESSGREQ